LPPNPAELLHNDNMQILIEHGVALYDLVIIDGPPVMGLADAPILGSVMEGTLLVVEAGVTRKGFAATAVKRMRATRSQLIGVLINKHQAKHSAYGYGYGGSDYYAYGVSEYKQLGK